MTVGISAIASAVAKAGSKQPVANVNNETNISNKLNPESYAKAKEGNPQFDTFRKRYWKAEAERAPELYGDNVAQMLSNGKAPVIDGEKLVLHHVAGRGEGNLYNVVVLPESQHIAFHKQFGYLDPKKWPNLWG